MEPCPYCGSRVDETSRTCAGCGAAVRASNAEPDVPPAQEDVPSELLEELGHLREKRLAEEAEREEEQRAESEAA